jgi:hypothetical protein
MPFNFDDDDTLPAEQLKGPVLAVKARILLADFSSKAGLHRFGGPLALNVGGADKHVPALHRVLTLSVSDPLLGVPMKGATELPLIYGFLYDGCRLKYRMVSDGQIELLKMSPQSPSANWPYPKYPASFPEKRFALRHDGQIEPYQVHELTWQGVQEIDPANGVVAIVPPSKKYGISLWGDGGDGELVQVVFEIDPAARTVAAYNQCG